MSGLPFIHSFIYSFVCVFFICSVCACLCVLTFIDWLAGWLGRDEIQKSRHRARYSARAPKPEAHVRGSGGRAGGLGLSLQLQLQLHVSSAVLRPPTHPPIHMHNPTDAKTVCPTSRPVLMSPTTPCGTKKQDNPPTRLQKQETGPTVCSLIPTRAAPWTAPLRSKGKRLCPPPPARAGLVLGDRPAGLAASSSSLRRSECVSSGAYASAAVWDSGC